MSDAWWYAVRPNSRSRSRSRCLCSSENCSFPTLSPPPFTMAAGKWPLILKLQHNTYIWSGRIFDICPGFCHVTLNLVQSLRLVRPQKKFFRFQWHLICRYRSMSDARPYAVWPDPRSRSRVIESHSRGVSPASNISGTAEQLCAKFTWKTFGPLLWRVWMSKSKVMVTGDKIRKTAASAPMTVHSKVRAVRCKWRQPAADRTIPLQPGGDRWQVCTLMAACLLQLQLESTICWYNHFTHL